MHLVQWDVETGGVLLVDGDKRGTTRGELRPVFYEELDLLGLDKFWEYPRGIEPLLWAGPQRYYYYRGERVARASGGGLYVPPKVDAQQGLKLEPIDVVGCLEKNAAPLALLEEQSLGFIRDTYEQFKDAVDASYVAFSGGKDSVVVLDLVQKALLSAQFHVVFEDSQMEFQATYEALEAAKQVWPQLTYCTVISDKNTLQLWREFGPPSRIHRWCCTVTKLVPFIKHLTVLTGNNAVAALGFEGSRSSESAARARRKAVSPHSKHTSLITACPILDWNSTEIYLHIWKNKLPLNRAYRYGMSRVGCIICPHSSSWREAITWMAYPDELEPFINVLRDYAANNGVIGEDNFRQYIWQRRWKARCGGRGVVGSNRVTADKANGVVHATELRDGWQEWLKILDDNVLVTENENGVSLIGKPADVTRMRAVARKMSYCVKCGTCVVECPTGALQMNNGSINIDTALCSKCGACLTPGGQRLGGCLLAQSVHLTSPKTVV